MAAVDVEWSIESAIVTWLTKLDGIVSLKEEQTTALKAFVDKKDVFAVLLTGFGKRLIYVTRFVALIGCRSTQLRPVAFWSEPGW